MTGTQSHEAMAGVTAAIEYLAELGSRIEDGGWKIEDSNAPSSILHPRSSNSRRQYLLAAMTAIRDYERGLAEKLIEGLLEIPGLTFYGIREPERFGSRTPTVAVRIEGHTPRELASHLGERGIFTWDGNYYALNLTERLGVEADGGMLRIGLIHYNTAAEVDRLLAALGEMGG